MVKKVITPLALGALPSTLSGFATVVSITAINNDNWVISIASLLIIVVYCFLRKAFFAVLMRHKVFNALFVFLSITTTLLPFCLYTLFDSALSEFIAILLAGCSGLCLGICSTIFYTEKNVEQAGWSVIKR